MSHHRILRLRASMVNEVTCAHMVNGPQLKGSAGDVTHSSVYEVVALCRSRCKESAIPDCSGVF